MLIRPRPRATDNTTQSARDLVKACRLNIAACHLKLDQPRKVVEVCTNVLEELDSRNPKALWVLSGAGQP